VLPRDLALLALALLALALLASLCTAGLLAAPLDLNLPPEPTAPRSEPASPLPTDGAPFTIAFLRGSDEFPINPPALRDSLNADNDFRNALRAAGRSAVELRGTDTHRELMRRMDNSEFDVVLAPALVYVRQQGRYEPLGQFGGQGIPGRSSEMGLLQTAVIFCNAACPLFQGPAFNDLTVEQRQSVAAEISSMPFAVNSDASAVGHVWPILTLRERLNLAHEPEIAACDTAEEVVMAVMNDLYPLGACDKATFERVVAEYAPPGGAGSIVRVLAETNPIPYSPICVRSEIHPSRAALGRSLSRAIDMHLDTATDPPLELEPAADSMFHTLRARVAELDRMRGPQ